MNQAQRRLSISLAKITSQLHEHEKLMATMQQIMSVRDARASRVINPNQRRISVALPPALLQGSLNKPTSNKLSELVRNRGSFLGKTALATVFS